MCPICWISGFIAALFGGSLIAVVNHPISWILSIFLISYAAYKFYEAKRKGKQMNQDTKARNKKAIFRYDIPSIGGSEFKSLINSIMQ